MLLDGFAADDKGLVVSKKSIPAPADFGSMKDYDDGDVPGDQEAPLLTSDVTWMFEHDSRCRDIL